MPKLLHHGEVVCMHGIFVDREKSAYNFYVGARDQAFSKLPSGLVLHGYAMRKAISEQIEKYDFLRGDEPYKYAFGANESRIQSVLISSRSGTNLGEKLDPRSWAYVKRRSREFLRNQDSDASRRALVQILEADPGDLSSQYLAGLVEAIDGDVGKAIEAFASVVSSSPNSLKAWYRLGRALAAHYENWNDASAAYSFLLKQPTDQRQVPLLLGRVLQRLGQFDLALAVWESALMRDPGNQELRRAVNSATSRVGGRDPKMNRRAHSTFGGAGPQQKKTSDKPGLLEDQIAGT